MVLFSRAPRVYTAHGFGTPSGAPPSWFSDEWRFGLGRGEVPPYKTHIHARKVHARRERRGGERVDVPLEQVDRAICRGAVNGMPTRPQSAWFMMDHLPRKDST